MRKHLISSFLIVLVSSISFSQGYVLTGLNPASNSTYFACDSLVTMSFSAQSPSTGINNSDIKYVISGTNFTGFQFYTMISWGDGSFTTHSGGTGTQGTTINMSPPVSHVYTSAGYYTISTTVINSANQSSVSDSIQYGVGFCQPTLITQVGVDCDSNGVNDTIIDSGIPLIVSNAFNSYNVNLVNGIVNLGGIPLGQYNITIAPSWLNANNYYIGAMTPSIITVSGASPIITSYFQLHCLGSQIVLCANGQVFCDANGNGVFNSGEIPLANAPITLTNNGVSQTVYSTANGYYGIDYFGTIGSPTTISISPFWLAANGYTSSNDTLNVLAVLCNSGTSTINNFPINCGTTPVNPTLCLSAKVFCDANGNGVYNVGESLLVNAPVTIWLQNQQNPMLSSITLLSDSSGLVYYCGQQFTSTIVTASLSTVWLQSNGYTMQNPLLTLVLGTPSSTSIPTGSFAVNCGGTTTPACVDLWTTVTPWIGYYQGVTNHIKLNWGNYGPGIAGAYQVTLTFPAGVSVITSSIANSNYTISGNTITWTLNNSATSFNTYDVIKFNTPTGIASGVQHNFTSTIVPLGIISNDCNTTNNAGNLLQIVGNSYDPNVKIVDRGIQYNGLSFDSESIEYSTDDLLTYTICFQNTGTAPAQNIYIIDTISSLLDLSTLRIIEATHAMQVVHLGNGIYRFEFPQIWLADSTTNEPMSHGHFVYSIKEKPGNALGSQVKNTAYIYFDWNAPIITNTTLLTNTDLQGVDEASMEQTIIYPNPTSDQLTISSLETISTYKIIDNLGRIIDQAAYTTPSIGVEQLAKGNYTLLLTTPKGVIAQRFIRN
jgi:uncharacterized repeat protein (TIGR01451 family)